MTMRHTLVTATVTIPLFLVHHALAQSVPAEGEKPLQAVTAKDARLEAVSKMLTLTQQQLEQTQQQLSALRAELNALRNHSDVGSAAPKSTLSAGTPDVSSSSPVNSDLQATIARQQEEQDVQAAEIKQHDQTKVESMSKYPVRVYGLLLFNTFANAGLVDSVDLPSAALPRTPGQSHGSVGGSFRQTLLGVSGDGPRVFGAGTSGDVSIDFFGDPSYNYYSSFNGNVRFRRGDVRLAWNSARDTERTHDLVQLGVDSPLISPLSPSSIATVAIPSLGWSGNLWTWAPELQYRHTFLLSSEIDGQVNKPRTVELEGGLWDPPVVGSNVLSSSRILSAGELSRRPGLLGRASLHAGTNDHPFSFGAGGYVGRQTYNSQQVDTWAVTGDWQIPLSQRFQLDGEIYRGAGLGGLGGGAYKDVLQGTSIATGTYQTIGLNAVGGWAQLKTHFGRDLETNIVYGQDDAFASDFHQLNFSQSVYPLEQNARTQTIMVNVLYRPKTYLILSPEYRRLSTWTITGPSATANIFTMSVGYQF